MKACKICKEKFSPFQTTQQVCGVKCAIAHAREKEVKKAEKEHKARKHTFRQNDIKLRRKAAQAAFNAYIRVRDSHLPCISCQRHHKGQYHCGHFKTTAARPDLRFDEDNCHKQCSACNNHLSGNIENYRPNLIDKIGRDRFNFLELEKQVKYTAQEYKEIELRYKEKLKVLKQSVH